MQIKDTFPEGASMAAPGLMKYDGSHKLRQISVRGGGIGLNSRTRMAEIGQLANVEALRVLLANCPLSKMRAENDL